MSDSRTRALSVFLCHGSEDKQQVRDIYMRLRQDGVDPWLDSEKLLPGQDWDYAIRQAVKASDVILVCLSRKSVSKEGYVQREIKFALNLAEEKPEGTIFIIPVKLEECEVPGRLSHLQHIEYDPGNGHTALIRSLRERSRGLGFSMLPGDGALLRFNQGVRSVLGRRLYSSSNVQDLLAFYRDGILDPEDVDRLESNVVVAISHEALDYLKDCFPDKDRRSQELKTLLALIGITEPYDRWDEFNSKAASFRNEESFPDEPIRKVRVASSNLHSIGYDGGKQILEVSFLNGSTYRYFDIPEYLYEGLMSASSHGKYLDAYIKRGGFRYQQM